MRLIIYELRKICGIRYLSFMLAALVILCAGLFFYQNDGMDPSRERQAEYEKGVREYNESPERIDAAWEKYLALREQTDELRRQLEESAEKDESGFITEEAQKKIDEIMSSPQFQYEDTLGFDVPDSGIFSAIRLAKAQREGYIERLDEIIKSARGVMLMYEMAGADDTPVYELEKHVYEKYSAMRDSIINKNELYYTYGWWNLFFFDDLGIFIYAFLLFAAGVIFLYERQTGVLPILRTTRRGRMKTTASKLAALVILSVFAVFVFSLALFLVCLYITGFSSPTVQIQFESAFYNVPYTLNFWQYSLLLFGTRCICAAAFSCVVALASSLTFSPVVTYGVGAGVLTANIILNYVISYSGLTNLNLLAMMTESTLVNYSEISLFGRSVPLFELGFGLYVSVTAISALLIILFGGRRRALPSLRVKNIKDAARRLLSKIALMPRLAVRARSYPRSLLRWELGKLFTPGVIFAAAILFFMSAYETYGTYSSPPKWEVRESSDYLRDNYFGEATDDKFEKLRKRRAELNEFSSMEHDAEMMELFRTGKITSEEYTDYVFEAMSAQEELKLLSVVQRKAHYLEDLYEKHGVRGWFISDAPLTRLFSRDINVFLFAAVLIVFGRAYAADFAGGTSEGDFMRLQRTTRYGRRASFRAKLGASLLGVTLVALPFFAVEFIAGALATEDFAKVLTAPASSITSYGEMGGISVAGFVALMFAVRYLACVMLALLTLASSFAFHRVTQALSVTALFTLVPYLLVYIGTRIMRYFDFTAMFAGGKLLLRSAEYGMFGSQYGFLLLFIIGYGALTAAAMLAVRHKTDD